MALKQKLGLDIDDFKKGLNDAKGLSSTASEFFIKQFAKAKIKSAISTPEFKANIDSATNYLVSQFQKVKPQIQSITQTIVKEGTEASIKTASIFASPAIKGGFQALTAVGIPAAIGLAAALGPLAIAAGVTVEALKLLDDAFQASMKDISDMVAIADKAQNLNLTPSFLQGFLSESQKLKVSADDLESALKTAFDATKEQSPIDLDKWDAGKDAITAVEKELRVYNETVAKAAGTQLQGLTLFRDADTQQQKVTAVLTAMTELDKIGAHLESLKLGETMFGSAFVDNIRTGKTSAESILASMQAAKAADSGIFSDAMVTRAKQVDDDMKLASQHLSEELKPGFAALETSILNIESSWAKMVELMAEAVKLTSQIPWERIANAIAFVSNPIDYLTQKIGKASGLIPTPMGPNMKGLLTGGDDAPPKPSKGPGPAPTLKATDTGGSDSDPLGSAENSITKRTAATLAEANAIDLGTAAREKARVAAQLTAIAIQANTKAGKDDVSVTDEQKASIDKVATAYGNAAAKIEQAHSPMQEFIRQSADLNKQLDQFGADSLNGLTDGLADALTGVKSLKDAFADLVNQVINDLAKIAIRKMIVAPLAGFLGLADGGPVSGVAAFNSGSHLYADGGTISGPGGPRSDSIPIMASNGEFIVNSAATAKHGRLLHAINSGKLLGFADGGPIGSSAGGSFAPAAAPTIHAPVNVTVNTKGGGTPAQNRDMADQVGRSVRDAVDSRFSENLRQAMRPGGVLHGGR